MGASTAAALSLPIPRRSILLAYEQAPLAKAEVMESRRGAAQRRCTRPVGMYGGLHGCR
jgi:hypothetical protein